ncbi:hypothetical protein JHK87_054864 [Glycine soja]|nr:hypothetical protein JHK87_054864 [Glycine soja]
MKNRYLAHAQHHPPFHDSALPKRKLDKSCTVKSPSQYAMDAIISKGKSSNKPLVVVGCFPQGSRDLKELERISIIGVQQINRVFEIVEKTLKGHEVRLLTCQKLATLELQKVRKNEFVEILPINVGCLGACTYCKTKHVRGHLGSYTIDSLIGCVKSMISEGVRALLWKVVYSEHSDPKSLWVATLDPNGAITFYDLNKRRAPNPEAVKVPQDPCGIPQSSDLYCGCFFENCSDAGHGNKKGRNDTVLVVVIFVLTVLIIVGLITGFWYYYKRKTNVAKYPQDNLDEDDNFLDRLSGMPAHFTFAAFCRATEDFSRNIAEGGFGSVYLGVLEDGTQLAVKKLEGVGQGAKEFKAEVSIVGSIHHVHLVKLSVIVQVEEIFPHMTELTSFCSSHLCNKDIL